MSKVIQEENRHCHIVECFGKTFFVVSGKTFENGLATWVCKADPGAFDYYSDREKLYVEKHENIKDMEFRHLLVSRQLEKFMKGAGE